MRWLVLPLLLLPLVGDAQERVCDSTRFFTESCAPPPPPSCDGAQFFGPECVSLSSPSPVPALSSQKPSPEPLFTKETMAPNAPPLMTALLNAPTPAATLDAAHAFLRWQQARQSRIQEIETLLRTLKTGSPR